MPNVMPRPMCRIQLVGRAKPISRHGVRDAHAQRSTRMALRGAKG